jgi:RTA1 like protein
MESSYRVPPAGSAVFLAAFAALIPINIFNGIRYKTPAYALVLTVALILEAISHIGRIFMSNDSATKSHAILYTIGTHWGPILIGSAIYMILPHVTVIYGQQFRLVSKGIYLNIAFVLLDLFALVFQFVGIVVVVNASTSSQVSLSYTAPILKNSC